MPTDPIGSSASPCVMLLCASDDYAAIEKRALRDAGVKDVRLFTSGAQAARILAGLEKSPDDFRPDIIICAQKLADMDGEQFCAIIRLHPLLLALPILLILPSGNEAEQLRTLGCGASGLLGRPYTVDELLDQLSALSSARMRLEKLEQAARHADTRAFDEAVATYGSLLKPARQPEDFFRVGMRCLQESKWNNALNAFQRALRSAQIKGEAELGMACAWRGKGDQRRFRAWLARAADTFVQARRWHTARVSFARLLQDDPGARNPYLKHAKQLIGSGQMDEAAEMLAQGFEVSPRLQFRNKLVQTCLAHDEPKAMLDALESSLEKIMGSKGNGLADAVRANLDILVYEQREQRRLASLDRQWHMSRKLSEMRRDADAPGQIQAPEQDVTVPSSPVPSEVPAPPPLTLAKSDAQTTFRDRGAAHMTPADITDSADREDEEVRAGERLSEIEATSGLFAGSPRLNELLSVIKLTWKLMRRLK